MVKPSATSMGFPSNCDRFVFADMQFWRRIVLCKQLFVPSLHVIANIRRSEETLIADGVRNLLFSSGMALLWSFVGEAG